MYTNQGARVIFIMCKSLNSIYKANLRGHMNVIDQLQEINYIVVAQNYVQKLSEVRNAKTAMAQWLRLWLLSMQIPVLN